MSVGFMNSESWVKTVLVTFYFEEQRLIGLLSNLLNGVILFEKPNLWARSRNELIWPPSLADKNPLHTGRTYRNLERIKPSKTVLR